VAAWQRGRLVHADVRSAPGHLQQQQSLRCHHPSGLLRRATRRSGRIDRCCRGLRRNLLHHGHQRRSECVGRARCDHLCECGGRRVCVADLLHLPDESRRLAGDLRYEVHPASRPALLFLCVCELRPHRDAQCPAVRGSFCDSDRSDRGAKCLAQRHSYRIAEWKSYL
jgi:hypothetical protein